MRRLPLSPARRAHSGYQGASCAALIAAFCGGCSSESTTPTYPATVTIVYSNGKPVQGASITFRSLADKSITAKGRAGQDGLCQLTTYEQDDGAVLGEHEAIVVQGFGNGDLDETRMPTVDPRFSSYATSRLSFTVTEDERENRFRATVAP